MVGRTDCPVLGLGAQVDLPLAARSLALASRSLVRGDKITIIRRRHFATFGPQHAHVPPQEPYTYCDDHHLRALMRGDQIPKRPEENGGAHKKGQRAAHRLHPLTVLTDTSNCVARKRHLQSAHKGASSHRAWRSLDRLQYRLVLGLVVHHLIVRR